MDTVAILVQSVVTFAAIGVVGAWVDWRAQQRDRALRSFVVAMARRVDAGLAAVDAAAKGLAVDARTSPSSVPPTLQ